MSVKAVTLESQTVTGGSVVQGTVHLPCPAAPDSVVVSLASSDPSVAAPVTDAVVVPAGDQDAPFEVRTYPVSRKRSASIAATAAGLPRSRKVTVIP
jgi:hypothetical protein